MTQKSCRNTWHCVSPFASKKKLPQIKDAEIRKMSFWWWPAKIPLAFCTVIISVTVEGLCVIRPKSYSPLIIIVQCKGHTRRSLIPDGDNLQNMATFLNSQHCRIWNLYIVKQTIYWISHIYMDCKKKVKRKKNYTLRRCLVTRMYEFIFMWHWRAIPVHDKTSTSTKIL